MNLASDSHQRLEEFFREYFQDQRFHLPKICVYCGKFTQLFTKTISVHGITFGCRIFILPSLITYDQQNRPRFSENLAAHEITHSIQFQKHGFFGFFYNYLKSYMINLKAKKSWDLSARQDAYLEIPFEVEARDAAAKFVIWNKTRKAVSYGEN